MDKIIINLNDKVRFKLTDLGREIYFHQFDHLEPLGIEPARNWPEEDAEGYTSMHLWRFIEVYGSHIGMTKKNVIEPLNLIVEEPRLMSCPPEPEDTAPPVRKRQRVEICRGGDNRGVNELLKDGWRVLSMATISGFQTSDGGYYRPYTEYLLEREETDDGH